MHASLIKLSGPLKRRHGKVGRRLGRRGRGGERRKSEVKWTKYSLCIYEIVYRFKKYI